MHFEQEKGRKMYKSNNLNKNSFVLAAFDYSQIEMRILTHMSQDKFLLDFFKSGLDIHKLVAGRWLGN